MAEHPADRWQRRQRKLAAKVGRLLRDGKAAAPAFGQVGGGWQGNVSADPVDPLEFLPDRLACRLARADTLIRVPDLDGDGRIIRQRRHKLPFHLAFGFTKIKPAHRGEPMLAVNSPDSLNAIIVDADSPGAAAQHDSLCAAGAIPPASWLCASRSGNWHVVWTLKDPVHSQGSARNAPQRAARLAWLWLTDLFDGGDTSFPFVQGITYNPLRGAIWGPPGGVSLDDFHIPAEWDGWQRKPAISLDRAAGSAGYATAVMSASAAELNRPRSRAAASSATATERIVRRMDVQGRLAVAQVESMAAAVRRRVGPDIESGKADRVFRERQAARGRRRVASRQAEIAERRAKVAAMTAAGHSARVIADTLGTTVRTIYSDRAALPGTD